MPISKIKTSSITADAASTNLNIDANTLFLDAANNRVGIGTNNPSANLDITNAGNATLRLTAGNTSSSIIQLGDTADGNVGEITYSHSTNSMAFDTNDVERMRIDSSGNVGIGTTTIGTKLVVADTGQSLVGTAYNVADFTNAGQTLGTRIGYDSSNGAVIASAGVDKPIAFWQYNTSNYVERMRLDASGNLGLGITANTTSIGGTYSLLAVGKSGGSGIIMGQTDATAADSTAAQFLGKTTGTSGYQLLGGMLVQTDGSSTANAVGRLTFYTATGGSLSERMRITAAGNVGIGKTDPGRLFHIKASDAMGSGTGLSEIALLSNSNLQASGVAGDRLGFTMSAQDDLADRRIGMYLTAGNANSNNPDITWWQTGQGVAYREVMRLSAQSGLLFVGASTEPFGQNAVLNVATKTLTEATVIAAFGYVSAIGTPVMIATGNSTGQNNAATVIRTLKNGSTGRSISTAGTINASGADYAEYMVKCSNFTIAKGDICGIDINGKLTNVFADSISFVVKSTDPSYVGGDSWGSNESLGLPPLVQPPDESTDEEEKAKYLEDKAIFDAALENARKLVDRIAFSGQVPVNVLGASAGQYIVPVNDNGNIKGIAVNEEDLTMAQYIKAVGKVITIQQDNRAKIIVKVA